MVYQIPLLQRSFRSYEAFQHTLLCTTLFYGNRTQLMWYENCLSTPGQCKAAAARKHRRRRDLFVSQSQPFDFSVLRDVNESRGRCSKGVRSAL
jgi:hypothetical protein